MGKVKRPYRSPLRAQQAQQTRRLILDAAQRLFLNQGYPATSIEAIASAASVSQDTVYSAFGTKRNLLQQLMDVVIGGDDADVRVVDRPESQATRQQPDRQVQLSMFAKGVARRVEGARPLDDILRSAAEVDVEVRALRDDIQLRQRRSAMGSVADWLAESGPFRDGITVEETASILWTLTSPDVHRLLRDGCGWSHEHYVQWLRNTLVWTLLPVQRAPNERADDREAADPTEA